MHPKHILIYFICVAFLLEKSSERNEIGAFYSNVQKTEVSLGAASRPLGELPEGSETGETENK